MTKNGYDEGLLALRSEAGSFGYWKNHVATGQVYGPFDLYVSFTDVELSGYRDYSDQIRHRISSMFRYDLSGGTTPLLDLGDVRNDETLPGALTRDELERDPRKADPTNVATRAARRYDYVRGAMTLRTPLGETAAVEAESLHQAPGLAVGPGGEIYVTWASRRPKAANVLFASDLQRSRSRDGGRTVEPATRVHTDNWKISACPHRGGAVAIDARGRTHAEGTRNEPDILYAIAPEGQRFGAPRRIHVSASSIPDHARLALVGDGNAVVVWEDSTAVRRRVMLREITPAGVGPVRTLSGAVKAYAPDVSRAPDGDIFVAWHEERFPKTVTVVLRLGAGDLVGRKR